MIPFKNHIRGFSLIEVIIAIFMVAIAVLGVLGSQASFLLRTAATADDIRVTLAAKNFLYEHTGSLVGEKEEPLALPRGTMKYSVTNLSKKESFKNCHDLYLEQVTVSWSSSRGPQEKVLSRISYRPQKEKRQPS